jgi:hypothetical protein
VPNVAALLDRCEEQMYGLLIAGESCSDSEYPVIAEAYEHAAEVYDGLASLGGTDVR